jgi:hypothetical protein
MTPEQEANFISFGCGSRCIIKLAEWQNKPISRETFIDHFAPRFASWANQCGIVSASDIVDITRELGLATGAESLRGRPKVRQIAEAHQTRGIFVLTERGQGADGNWGDYFHIRLLRGFAGDCWLLWHPDQNGQDFDNLPVNENELEAQLAHFLLLT